MDARPGLHRSRRPRPHPRRASSRASAWRSTAPGRIRPHERTHPGPKEDRLRLTRATRANLSPIFSLYSDPGRAPPRARWPTPSRGRRPPTTTAPSTASGGSRTRRRSPPPRRRSQDTELLIADGHHRYETARVYAEEIGGEGPHRYVLMCLVALEDPGLTVFPTHRLVRGLSSEQQEALAAALRRDFEIQELGEHRRAGSPRSGDRSGSATSTRTSAGRYMLTLKDPAIADAALPGPRRALPPARHRGAGGADPQGRAGHDRRRHR